MACMDPRIADFSEAAELLPNGASLVIQDLQWDDYEAGKTTWKRRSIEKGAEPDECYYIENTTRIIGKRKFDLEIDPPPDIVVEIDITNSSLRKFSIYAALGVPEIWRYDRKTVHFYELVSGSFVETKHSRFLPGLTGQIMVETIKASVELGQTEALKAFRKQIQSFHPR
jgi:Uma2 family endonuclease